MGDDISGESGEDHISGLPDELLHVILLRLDSLPDAARTSVLSRRWRRVWTYLPQLILSFPEEEDEGSEEASSIPDTVDAVLAASAAPAIELLSIYVPVDLIAQRIAPWLRFALERVTGKISLDLPGTDDMVDVDLELPTCARATSIELKLQISCKLRPTGVFPMLTCLNIAFVCMDGGELSDLVSMRCPRLKSLSLIIDLSSESDVSIRSDSLHWLCLFIGKARRKEVIAPRLEELIVCSMGSDEIHISAPKLANIIWKRDYNPRCHLFTHVSRRLHLLQLRLEPTIIPLMKQFNEVDELRLDICIGQGTAEYKNFMNITNWLSKCEYLRISLCGKFHGFVPTILHLLRCCNTIKKLSVQLNRNQCGPLSSDYCPLDCPCRLAERHKIDDITLLSLEEVQIVHFVGSQGEMEFVKQLSQCNAPILKTLGIFGKRPESLLTKEVREKVRCLCRPNLKVEFYHE